MVGVGDSGVIHYAPPRFLLTSQRFPLTAMLAHVHIMKTAGQTVCDILRQSFPGDHCDLRCGNFASRKDVQFSKNFYPNLQSISGHSIRPWSDLADIPGIRFFTILRDPIQRSLSHYQFDLVRNCRSIDFLDWLKQKSNYQTQFLCRSENAQHAIDMLEERVGMVGLMEDFDHSLDMLRSWSGYQLAARKKSRNVSSDQSVKDRVLDNSSYVDALYSAHEADLKLYAYAKNVIYPRQMQRHEEDQNVPLRSSSQRYWPKLKRNAIYKPLAKLRQSLSKAA